MFYLIAQLWIYLTLALIVGAVAGYLFCNFDQE